nr:hypothetical protein [Tanacetum cinerariifolium]
MLFHIIVKDKKVLIGVALDETLVLHASRLRIGKSNFRLRSDIKSKESTLQVVYDVLKLTPFYKAFLVTADVPEIYMQEFWATATVHHNSIRFKMNNTKRIVSLEYFREMLQISPRITIQQFDELPFKEEILAFLRKLGHSRAIKKITDVNINKLHQPWRSFSAVINKCLSGKSTGYDSLRLSQAQILWGMYHKKNMDFAYLLWEDFMYQVEHKDVKKSNEMYYPWFTKVIINIFMTKDQSIPRRNKVNWHYAMDDQMFTTIKLVSKHQNTQQYGVILPVELTNEAIRNSKSYKEYYDVASGAEPPKKKATKVDKPAKEKQPAKSSTAKGLTMPSEVALIEAEQINLATKKSLTQTHISNASRSGTDEGTDDQYDQDNDDDEQTNSDNDSDHFVHPKFSTHDEEAKDEESFDPIVQTPFHDDKDDDEDNDEDSDWMNVEGDEGANEEDDADELYRDVNINLEGRDIQMADVQTTQVIEDIHVTLTLVNPEGQQQSSSVSSRFISNMLNPSPDTCIDYIFDSTLRVDVLVSTATEPPLLSATTLPRPTISITCATNTSSFTTADLSELELKKILTEKMESNKSILRSDEQKNLYKALVDTYEYKEPFAGSNRGSKRRREGKEPESTSAPKEKTSKTSGKSIEGSKSQHKIASNSAPHPHWFQKQAKPPTPDSAWNRTLPATHGRIQPWISNLAKKADSRTSFNELMDTLVDFSAFMMNRLKVDTLTLELLAGPTYELMKGSCKSLVELEYFLEEGISHWGRRRQQFYGFVVNRESAQDAVTELQIIKWHNYKHLDWITVCRDDDKLYKFKEGDFKRLRIQDIEYIIVIQRRVEDIQLGVKSYQKKLNLTKPDTYRSNLKRKEDYTTYSNPRRFIYQNKDKQNRLMRIDELDKFSHGTLNDVQTALDDRLNGIRIQYLP